MTINTSDLPTAKLGGLEFFWVSDSADIGRKKVSFEYPNRNTRFVEDLGLLPKKFSISGRIFYSTDNLDNLNAFEEMLESSGNKELVLPLSQKTYTVAIMPSRMVNSRDTLGYADFTLNLEVADVNQYPITTNTSVGFIDRLTTKLFGENNTVLNSFYESVQNKVTVIQSLSNKIKASGEYIREVAQRIVDSTDDLSNFVGQINNFTAEASILAQTPSLLGDNLKSIFETLESSVSNSQNTFNILKNYFNFSTGDQQSVGTGNNQNILNNNQALINNYISTVALSQAYVSGTNIDFTSSNDLELIRKELEESYRNLPDNLNSDIKNTIDEVRVNANAIFDQKVVNLPELVTISVARQPLVRFVYQYYGSLANYDIINDINQFDNPAQIEGDVLVLSA